jgi:16S rRNA (cytosine1402-N4)-methyltransferase
MIPVENIKAHQPVLFDEVITHLVTDTDGFYVDGTFGRGGHSKGILRQLTSKGRLLAYDKDKEAADSALELKKYEPRFNFIHNGFENIKISDFKTLGVKKPKGILLDLGLSSPQLDTASRGFSFMRSGDLDMRYDQNSEFSAYHLVNEYSEEKLVRVIRDYGEEVNAKLIVKRIILERDKEKIISTAQLAKLIEDTVRKKNNIHPATKTFQAIRIAVNDELNCISIFLNSLIDLLDIGGRVAIISFHSLEDRLVKRFILKYSTIPKAFLKLNEIPVNVNPRLKPVGKLIKPNLTEVSNNPRSRSARLRVFEKIR